MYVKWYFYLWVAISVGDVAADMEKYEDKEKAQIQANPCQKFNKT